MRHQAAPSRRMTWRLPRRPALPARRGFFRFVAKDNSDLSAKNAKAAKKSTDFIFLLYESFAFFAFFAFFADDSAVI